MKLKKWLLGMLLIAILTLPAFAELLSKENINSLMPSDDCLDREETIELIYAISQTADMLIEQTAEQAVKEASIPLLGEIAEKDAIIYNLQIDVKTIKKGNIIDKIMAYGGIGLAIVFGVLWLAK